MNTAPDDRFIPLTPRPLSRGERPDYRVTVVRQGQAKPTAGVDQNLSSPSLTSAAANDPRVTLQREGDRVSAIRIQCACGRTAELACVYEPAPAQNTAPPPGAPAAPGATSSPAGS
jgi:hypothetical protein